MGLETTTQFCSTNIVTPGRQGWAGLVELVNKTVRHFFSPNTSSMFHRDSLCCNSKETELPCWALGDKTWPPVTLGETPDSLSASVSHLHGEIRVIVFMTWSHGFLR